MQYTISPPKRLDTEVELPASKSISNRALIMHALAHGTHMPQNLSDCDDTKVMAYALNHPDDRITDIHAAGTAMRFLTAYFSVTSGMHTLTGTARMRQRPIHPLVNALRGLGADIEYTENEGYPPLRINGTTLHGQDTTLPGDISSQYISALLMIGPVLPQGLRIHLQGTVMSRPYIDLTLHMMHTFGIQARWTDRQTIKVEAGQYKDTDFHVEADWSAASYWYEIMALTPCPEAHVRLKGLLPDSAQGDSRGAALFEGLGVRTIYDGTGVTLRKTSPTLVRAEACLADMPDLAQTFVVTCCLADIPFRFTGLQSLRIKETDRISALINELRKLGYVLKAEGDNALTWDKEYCQPQHGQPIATYDDHRMAMAFAPACLRKGPLSIAHTEVVAKSYPAYWKHLHAAGFTLTPGTDL